MNPTNPSHSTVKHTPISQYKAAAGLADLVKVVQAAGQCAAVQSSPAAKAALDVLDAAVGAGQTALASKLAAIQAHKTATTTLTITFNAIGDALRSFEAAVNVVAGGNGAVINQAGLLARGEKTPPVALGEVTVVRGKPGKLPAQAIVSWPEVPGATSYLLEVNFTPTTPGAWTPLNPGTGRRRTIVAPTVAAQFEVRVAALRSDGTQSPWSSPVLVTAC